MKAVGYVRVSTAHQVEDGVSMDAQVLKLQGWAAMQGCELVVFKDAGISGKRANNRPGLKAALEAIERGDALVCYSLSRLSRSVQDTLSIADALQKRGGELVSLSEQIDTSSAAGKMVFRMLAVVAEFERDCISERTAMGLSYKKALGQKTGGDVPYGFRLAEDGVHLERNEQEQKAISLIHSLRDKGYSLRQISGELEREGYLTRQGKASWSPVTVNRIVQRRVAA